MKSRKFDDPDRPIETYPGYLGLYHDGSYDFDAVLKPLLAFPWREYRDFPAAEQYSSERTMHFSVGSKLFSLTFDRGMIELMEFLEKLPTVDVISDEDLGDLGPGSGGIITIFENDDFTLDEIKESITSSLSWLTKDFELLKQHLANDIGDHLKPV
jgi:hypothetical protein